VAWRGARVATFMAVSVRLAYGNPRLLRTHLVGNPGDAFLVSSILQWGAKRSTSGYLGYWKGPFFAGSHDVMAFTDTFLPLTPPFRLLATATGSTTVAMNLLYLMSWILTAEATYHLVLRLSRSRGASFVGALAFTFSTIRLSQSGHYQLAFAFFIPFTMVIVFQAIDRPTVRRGLLIGTSIAFQFLTSAYYGVILATCVAVIAASAAAARRGQGKLSLSLRCWLAATFALALMVVPVGLRYLNVQSATQARGQYPEAFALRLGDLRTADPQSTFLNKWSLVRNSSASRSSENYAYVGGFVILLIPVLIAAIALSKNARESMHRTRFEVGAVVFVGVVGLLIALGRGPILGFRTPFYDIARHIVPGVRTMLAIVRLTIFFQLALVCLASMGLALALRHLQRPVARRAVLIAVCGLVLLESSTKVPLVRVPTPRPGSTYDVLKELPGAVIVELPMPPRSTGVVHAFIESTRQVLGSNDGQRTMNGYSGYAPADYEKSTVAAAEFPSASSVAVFKAHGVKYVVLHTGSLDTGLDDVSDAMNASGYAFVSTERADAILAEVANEHLADVVKATDGFVFVLR
jgi:hypothetical protein